MCFLFQTTGAIMNTMHTFFSRHRRASIPRYVAIILLVLVWNHLAFCGEVHVAAESGDLEKVKALLKENHDLVFSRDTNGVTPLLWAAFKGHKDVAELLLANQAEVDATNNFGATSLHLAAFKGHEDVAELLLADKADVNAKDNEGRTPLSYAGSEWHKEVAELLRQHGGKDFCAEINDAIKAGNLEQVKVLLKEDPNLVHGRDSFGKTLMHTVVMWGKNRAETVELLLANRADVNARDTDGDTPLHLAVNLNDKDLVKLLLANKADVNARGNIGWTPLHRAAYDGKRDLAELLLADKADVNAKDKDGRTPLDCAEIFAQNNKEVIALLLTFKCDVNGLEKLLTEGKDIWIRLAAARALSSDQTRLMQFASSHPAAEVRGIAIREITNETFLLARSREDSSAAVRATAVMVMKSPDALLAVATNSYHGDLRELVAKYKSYWLFDSAAKAKVDAANKLREQQIVSIGTETNQTTLADTALNGKFDTICLAAVKQLSDQSLLAKVAMKTADREIAKAALARLTDAAALGGVATGASDPAMRVAAAVAQNATTWQSVFSKAAQGGDSKSLGDALAAVSLSPAQDGISNVVTEACLTLIRRGDESRILELSDLLDRYGDKTLCEDYLNCGQPDLNRVASSWAKIHGYNVSTGSGSGRARWGGGR
jgi:ankyrin repeat protein